MDRASQQKSKITESATTSDILNSSANDASSTTTAHRTRHTSISPRPPSRSDRSRITVVEDHPELATIRPPDTYKVVTYEPAKLSRMDHFLGLFGVDVSKRTPPVMHEEIILQPVEVDTPNPWILPVYVLSSRRDSDRNQVVVEAQCTIDTGNTQGNIVSKEFVQEVLGYAEANYCRLTEDEKLGGTGVTGHRLIPEGAIYLTWYHKKSTRVFRNMRFLITSNSHCDLVIGAQSIMKDNILTVPNLMVRSSAVRTNHPRNVATRRYLVRVPSVPRVSEANLPQHSRLRALGTILRNGGARISLQVLLLFLAGIIVLILFSVIKHDLGTGTGVCALVWTVGGVAYTTYKRIISLPIPAIPERGVQLREVSGALV